MPPSRDVAVCTIIPWPRRNLPSSIQGVISSYVELASCVASVLTSRPGVSYLQSLPVACMVLLYDSDCGRYRAMSIG